MAKESDSAAEDDCCEQDKRKASCRDEFTASKAFVYTQNKTKSDGTTDNASNPDKDKLFILELCGIVLFITTELE